MGFVNLFVRMQLQTDDEAILPQLSLKQPELESVWESRATVTYYPDTDHDHVYMRQACRAHKGGVDPLSLGGCRYHAPLKFVVRPVRVARYSDCVVCQEKRSQYSLLFSSK